MRTRLLVVDDHQIFREALLRLLLSVTDLEVVGQASTGAEVIELAETTSPAVVCMDINLPDINGIEVTRALRSALPKVKVVALSSHLEQRYVLEMLKAGASGYVTKSEGCEELLHAIRAAAKGRTYLSSDATDLVAGDLIDKGTGRRKETIGAREWQVLKLVTDGLTSKAIASQLCIAVATVEVHRRNIMRKLNIHSVSELTRYVDRHQ